MKIVALLISLLLSCAVNAQAVESQKLFTWLMWVAGSDEDPDSGRDAYENTVISDAGAKALVTYARGARDEANRIGAANARGFCTSKEALRSGDALARRFEADKAQERAMWKAYDQNLVTVLSPEDESKIRNWVDHEFKISFGPDTDIATEIRSGRITPDQMLARLCPSPEDIARWQAMEKAQAQEEAKRAAKRPVPEPMAKAEPSKTRRLASAGAAPARPTEPQSSLITLSRPAGYSQCEAWAINNVGLIVGMCWKDLMHPVPVRWQQGAAEILSGPLRSEGSDTSDVRVVQGMAVAVNDAGDIVGSLFVENAAKRPGTRVAIWAEGYWRDLGFPKGARGMSARGINARGDVIGTANGHAAVYWRAEDRFEMLPNPQNLATAMCSGMAINNQGQAVGMCTDSIPSEGKTSNVLIGAAVLWQNHTATTLANPCAPEGDMTPYARTISDSGVIGGTSGLCALVWHASTPDAVTVVADRGVINSINKRGEMVGSAGDPAAKKPLLGPARWVNNEAPAIDLGPSTTTEGRVRAINDRGVFVGGYTSTAGESFAFVSQ